MLEERDHAVRNKPKIHEPGLPRVQARGKAVSERSKVPVRILRNGIPRRHERGDKRPEQGTPGNGAVSGGREDSRDRRTARWFSLRTAGRGKPTRPVAEIWSLGVLFPHIVEALNGVLPKCHCCQKNTLVELFTNVCKPLFKDTNHYEKPHPTEPLTTMFGLYPEHRYRVKNKSSVKISHQVKSLHPQHTTEPNQARRSMLRGHVQN